QPANDLAAEYPNFDGARGYVPQQAPPFAPPAVPPLAPRGAQPPASASGRAWAPGNGVGAIPPQGQPLPQALQTPRTPLWPAEASPPTSGASQPQSGASAPEGWPNLWPEPPQSPRR